VGCSGAFAAGWPAGACGAGEGGAAGAPCAKAEDAADAISVAATKQRNFSM
jgi:hypothetical protein